LLTAANTFNAQAGGVGATSKYVTSMQINNVTGEIIITYDAANVGVAAAQNTLSLTPYVQAGGAGPQQLAAAITAAATGTVDWGCGSATNVQAAARGLPPVTAGTLLAKYAPNKCR